MAKEVMAAHLIARIINYQRLVLFTPRRGVILKSDSGLKNALLIKRMNVMERASRRGRRRRDKKERRERGGGKEICYLENWLARKRKREKKRKIDN